MNSPTLLPNQKELMQRFNQHLNEQIYPTTIAGGHRIRLDGITLHDLLIRNHAVISGSYILQLLYNEYYPYSDIDIFVEEKDCSQELIDSYWGLVTPTVGKNYGVMSEIVCVYTNNYTTDDELKLQLIVCKNDPRTHIIPKQFDLDICANYFDGHHFYSYFPNDIETKSTTYYFEYGDNHPELSNINLIKKITRICKYIRRGFHIQLDYCKSVKYIEVLLEILKVLKTIHMGRGTYFNRECYREILFLHNRIDNLQISKFEEILDNFCNTNILK